MTWGLLNLHPPSLREVCRVSRRAVMGLGSVVLYHDAAPKKRAQAHILDGVFG
jgi:hypothetical protein